MIFDVIILVVIALGGLGITIMLTMKSKNKYKKGN